MAKLDKNTAASLALSLYAENGNQAFCDGTLDSDGNMNVHITNSDGTVTVDYVTVNPSTGNYYTTAGGSGSLLASNEVIIPVSFTSDGTANKLQTTISFKAPGGPLSEVPMITPGNIVQSVSYCDTMLYPFITNVTATSATIVLNLANSANKFGAGTLKMNFKVSDRKNI